MGSWQLPLRSVTPKELFVPPENISLHSANKTSSAVLKIALRVLLVEDFGQVQEKLNFSLNFPTTCCVALG